MASELGAFLRARRARVTPGEVGLPGGGQRRTAGLRREEIALLAGISVDYYNRLEQGRERHPSGAVTTALARALRLNDDEHAHLRRLARPADGDTPPPAAPAADAGVLRLPQLVRPYPAYVLSRASDVLAANPEVLCLFPGLTDWPAEHRNTLRYTFCHPAARAFYVDWERRARESVANLRALLAAEPAAPELTALVAELSAASTEFARRWQRHDVLRRRGGDKAVRHPVLGRVTFDVQVLRADGGQRFCVFQTPPQGPDHDAVLALARLAREASGH